MRFLGRALILSIVFGVQSAVAGVRRFEPTERPLPVRSTPRPPGRGHSSVVWDTRRHEAVPFGGVDTPPAPDQPQPWLSDTRLFAGWRKVADVGPPASYTYGMAFDDRDGGVLPYSGAAQRDAPLSDMWKSDGARWAHIGP